MKEKTCDECGMLTTNPRFCCKSCSAKNTSRGKVHSEESKEKRAKTLETRPSMARKAKEYPCKECGMDVGRRKVYCSLDCRRKGQGKPVLPTQYPFEEWVAMGPYFGKSRRHASIRLRSRRGEPSITMSYARYLACIKERRWLDENEEAYLLDGADPWNVASYSMENVGVRLEGQGRKSKGLSKRKVDLVCTQCNKPFQRKLTDYESGLRRGVRNFFCSKTCSSDHGLEKRLAAMREALRRKKEGHVQDATAGGSPSELHSEKEVTITHQEIP